MKRQAGLSAWSRTMSLGLEAALVIAGLWVLFATLDKLTRRKSK